MQGLEPAKVDLSGALEAGAPAAGRPAHGLAGPGQGTPKRVFDAAVNDALGRQGLGPAETVRFEQHRAVTARAQYVQQPQAGNAAAGDYGIDVEAVAGHRFAGAAGHERPASRSFHCINRTPAAPG